jgi:predicted AAA+ superfamily ATPase
VGTLPKHYASDAPTRLIQRYVADYLTEEIATEALVRNVPSFAEFLRVAALADTELANFTNVARESGVSSPTVKEHYQILVDTMLGRFLPAYVDRPKRRVIGAPRFYFASVGVVNNLAKGGKLEPGSALFGKALENVVCHELSAYRAYRAYRESEWVFAYWRLASGNEVDLVVRAAELAIEVKATSRVESRDAAGLLALREDQRWARRLLVVCLETKRRRLANGVEVWPVEEFLRALWADSV